MHNFAGTTFIMTNFKRPKGKGVKLASLPALTTFFNFIYRIKNQFDNQKLNQTFTKNKKQIEKKFSLQHVSSSFKKYVKNKSEISAFSLKKYKREDK